MNALVIYYSKFGNTRRIAQAIAGTLGQVGNARALSIEQVSLDDVCDVDLVVMGSPTHYQAVPKAVRAFLTTFPRRSLKGTWVTAFDTSLKMWGPVMLLTAAHGLMAKLRGLGGKKVIRPQTFTVEAGDSSSESEVDLLYGGEVEQAQAWAEAILRRLNRGKER
jgi:flavodoxin